MRILFLAAALAGGLLLVQRSRKLAPWLALLWLLGVVYLAFVMRGPYTVPRMVLEPFHAVKLFLKAGNMTFLRRLGYLEGAVLNILLFIPFGYLLPLLWGRVDCWWKILLGGLAVSLVIELLQLVTRLGMLDLDDLMNNAAGAVLGCVCYKKWLRG